MNYLIVENEIITNIIVADAEFAALVGAKEDYLGAFIGSPYDPPTLDKLAAELAKQPQLRADVDYLAVMQGVAL